MFFSVILFFGAFEALWLDFFAFSGRVEGREVVASEGGKFRCAVVGWCIGVRACCLRVWVLSISCWLESDLWHVTDLTQKGFEIVQPDFFAFFLLFHFPYIMILPRPNRLTHSPCNKTEHSPRPPSLQILRLHDLRRRLHLRHCFFTSHQHKQHPL